MIVLKKVELSHFKNILDSGPVAIQPDVTCLVGKNESGKTAFLQALHRLNRHLLSLPFEERSTGFRWFFSFLAAFSAYEHSRRPIVILLDEPGTGLHARAQADFLRFIDERLSQKCQVIYTTHSPFPMQIHGVDAIAVPTTLLSNRPGYPTIRDQQA